MANLWNSYKETESVKSVFVVENPESSSAVCKAHYNSHSSGKGISEIKTEAFNNYNHLVYTLDLGSNVLESLPRDIFVDFSNIQILNLSKNRLKSLPDGIGRCVQVVSVDLSQNQLDRFPDDFGDVSLKLKFLNISHNPLFDLPKCIFRSGSAMEELHASNIGLKEIPEEIGQLENLIVLNLGGNILSTIPASFANLKKLVDLDLSGVRWFDTQDQRFLLTYQAYEDFMNENPVTANMNKKVGISR